MGRCCVAGCKSLIFLLNMVVLVIGLAIMGISGYLIYQQFEYQLWQQDGADGYVFIPFAVGLLIALMACCSSSAAMRERKCIMVFFATWQFIFGVAILAIGAGFLVLNNSASRVATTPVSQLAGNGGAENLDTYVSDFEVGVYNKCCVASDAPPSFCTGSDAMPGCIFDKSVYRSGNDVDEEFCKVITDPDNDAFNLCSGSEATSTALPEFQTRVASLMDTTLFGSGIAFVVFGSLLLIAFIGSCYIVCCNRRVAVEEPKPTVAQV